MIRPRPHQIEGIEIAAARPRFLFCDDMGVGKTLTMLWVCQHRPMPTLILCPKPIMRAAWQADAELIGIDSLHILHGTTPKRKRDAAKGVCGDPCPIVVTNFETIRRASVREWLIGAVGIKRLIVDESSKLKNHESKTTQAVIDLADRVGECYLLTGTPAPNNESEYWAQLRCLAGHDAAEHPAGIPGVAKPPNFHRWAHYWLVAHRRPIGGRTVTTGWSLNPSRAAAFQAMLATHSRVIRLEDVTDLPPLTERVIPVDMTADQASAYELMLFDLVKLCNDGTVDAVTAEAKLMKLRQIAGGHYYKADGTTETVACGKLDAVSELVESIGDRPLVIWAEFAAEFESIAKVLRHHGREPVQLRGGQKHDNGEQCRAFQAGEIDTLICHPQSVGHGVTLTRAAHEIVYSLSYSAEQRQQADRRIYRTGQTRPVIRYILETDNSIDGVIRQRLAEKDRRSSAMLDVVRALTGSRIEPQEVG